ncbi:hypothetical protein ACCO45_008554 [Purpureocillium lilacinum]|uniref:Uncharacterized protein n=1 Tax=Purpureocillium lilacinum TaxID=33203 RepID=A0ACC4DNL4_PURLI
MQASASGADAADIAAECPAARPRQPNVVVPTCTRRRTPHAGSGRPPSPSVRLLSPQLVQDNAALACGGRATGTPAAIEHHITSLSSRQILTCEVRLV